jgi:prepilin-type N-terminal cleavage/methylation domain-containing protein
MKISTKNYNRGFTIAEMIVSIGLFTVVAMIATSTLLSIINSNRKAESLKSVMNNLNFAVESMARNLRMGSNYHCGGTMADSDLINTEDCSSPGDSLIAFKDSNGDPSGYYVPIGGTSINKMFWDGSSFSDSIPLTAPEIVIEKLSFEVNGSTVGDNFQPKIIIIVKGYAKSKDSAMQTKSNFNIETMVSQRLMDI